MRFRYLSLAAMAFVLACADAPSAPQQFDEAASPFQQPGLMSYTFDGRPPPPWAIIEGGGTTEHGEPFVWFANLFINKPGNVAWVMFTGGTNVSFSPNARIMSVNGNVVGVGTLTVGGTTFQLSSVQTMSYDRGCTSPLMNRQVTCASFSGDGFSSTYSIWTGKLANDRNKVIGKPGDGDEVCYEACYIDIGTSGK